jgi:hypothetical protein
VPRFNTATKQLQRDLVTVAQRILWGLNYLDGKAWLSEAERTTLDSAIRVGEMLLTPPPPHSWRMYARPENKEKLAQAIRIIGARSVPGAQELDQFVEWLASSRTIAKLIFDQRSVELDAKIKAREAEWDALWEKTIDDVKALSKEALKDAVGGAASIAGGTLTAFFETLKPILLPLGAIGIGVALIMSRKGGDK